MVRFPRTAEREYSRALVRYVRATHLIFRETLRRAIKANRERFDDALLVSAMRFAQVDAREKAAQLTFDFVLLHELARKVDRYNSRTLKQVLGVPIAETPAREALMRTWALENAHLIESIQPLYFDQMARTIQRGLDAGTRPEDMIADIEHRFSVTRSRARLIARDQTASLNAKIAEHQQTSVGVTSYRWSTSGDERVRPTHEALDGSTRLWSDPHPTEGHPGAAINCRCVAIPIISEQKKSR